MRTPNDICFLCDENESKQKKSHIIPKFLAKGLYFDTSPKHSISFTEDGKSSKIQEIEREDFM